MMVNHLSFTIGGFCLAIRGFQGVKEVFFPGGDIYVCVEHCGDYDDHVGNDDDKNKLAVTN